MKDNSKFTAALYNLKDDIAEENDLAESQVERLQSMSDLLDGWESEMSKTAMHFEPARRDKT
jgi:hypothetical protein